LEQERDAVLQRMVAGLVISSTSDNTNEPLQQSNTDRHFQLRQGRNRCRNRPPMILSPVRGDILRTMPLKLSDPARERPRWRPERDGRVRRGVWVQGRGSVW